MALAWENFGKLGLPEATGLPALVLLAVFWAAFILLMRSFEKKGL
jgi:hypothetical protein